MSTNRRTFIGQAFGAVMATGAAKAATPEPHPIKGELLSGIAPLRPIRHPKLRVWKLGSLDHRIVPTQKAIEKLAEMLNRWDGQSDLDLIWGPELEVQQFDLGPQDIDIVVPVDAEVNVKDSQDGLTAEVKVTPQIRVITPKAD